MIMFYVNYVYTFVFKKVWDQFNESISSDIILNVTVKIFNTSAGFIIIIAPISTSLRGLDRFKMHINISKVENNSGYFGRDFLNYNPQSDQILLHRDQSKFS
jgi:hypothetical protein